MKKAAIVYQSKSGTTRALAEAMASFLVSRGIQAQAASISSANARELREADYLLLGCWTSGVLIALQHPERAWIDFTRALPPLKAEIGLFTTYKIATGGMFRKMAACLNGRASDIKLTLKSRNSRLTDAHKEALARFVGVA